MLIQVLLAMSCGGALAASWGQEETMTLRRDASLTLASQETTAQLPLAELSADTKQRLERIEEGIKETLIGRRLIAETSEVLRRQSERAAGEDGVLFLCRQPPVLAFGPTRMKTLSAGALELALVREMSRASMGLPFPMPEGDMAAYQIELEYAVDRAVTDDGFALHLRRAFRIWERKISDARAEHDRIAALSPEGKKLELPRLLAPREEFERIAYYLALFVLEPDEFYWAVERGRSWDSDAVRLTELEDFMERHGPDFASARLNPGGHYVRIGDRRYSPVLYHAARQLVESGGLARIREALGSFDTVPLPELKLKVNAWVRGGP